MKGRQNGIDQRDELIIDRVHQRDTRDTADVVVMKDFGDFWVLFGCDNQLITRSGIVGEMLD